MRIKKQYLYINQKAIELKWECLEVLRVNISCNIIDNNYKDAAVLVVQYCSQKDGLFERARNVGSITWVSTQTFKKGGTFPKTLQKTISI